MDDLQLVRDLHEERPAPSAEVVATARARLFSPALRHPAPRHPAPRRPGLHWRPAAGLRPSRRALRIVLPVSAVAAATAVATVLAAQGPAGPATPTGPRLALGVYQPAAPGVVQPGSAGSAQSALLTAAGTVGQASAAAFGRYWVTSSTVGNFIQVGPAARPYVIMEKSGNQIWTARSPADMSNNYEQPLSVQLASAADRAAWRHDGSPTAWPISEEFSFADPVGPYGPSGAGWPVVAGRGKLNNYFGQTDPQPFLVGHRFMSAQQVLALPADPGKLKALLVGRADQGSGGLAAFLFQVTPQILTMPVTPAVRSALYRMLASLPGVQNLGQVRDVAGQVGDAVAITGHYTHCAQWATLKDQVHWTFASCTIQDRLVINPATGMPLAQEMRMLSLPPGQSWSAPGGLLSYELLSPPHWTNTAPPGN
ncbi:MAG TPA: hypothetical protein VGH27_35025 [Streptosporangiaceae bacterium]|jgi:hypothetical protein